MSSIQVTNYRIQTTANAIYSLVKDLYTSQIDPAGSLYTQVYDIYTLTQSIDKTLSELNFGEGNQIYDLSQKIYDAVDTLEKREDGTIYKGIYDAITSAKDGIEDTSGPIMTGINTIKGAILPAANRNILDEIYNFVDTLESREDGTIYKGITDAITASQNAIVDTSGPIVGPLNRIETILGTKDSGFLKDIYNFVDTLEESGSNIYALSQTLYECVDTLEDSSTKIYDLSYQLYQSLKDLDETDIAQIYNGVFNIKDRLEATEIEVINNVTNYSITPVYIYNESGTPPAYEQRYVVKAKIGDFEYVGYLMRPNRTIITTETIENCVLADGKLYEKSLLDLLFMRYDNGPDGLTYVFASQSSDSVFALMSPLIVAESISFSADGALANGWRLYSYDELTKAAPVVAAVQELNATIYNTTLSYDDKVYYIIRRSSNSWYVARKESQ